MKAMPTRDKSHAIAAQKAKKLTEKFHVLIFFRNFARKNRTLASVLQSFLV